MGCDVLFGILFRVKAVPTKLVNYLFDYVKLSLIRPQF